LPFLPFSFDSQRPSSSALPSRDQQSQMVLPSWHFLPLVVVVIALFFRWLVSLLSLPTV
jgi:type VI protein secretion system component VasF